MPAVSLSPTTLTSTMSDPSIIKVTVTSPPNPLAVAVSPVSAPASPRMLLTASKIAVDVIVAPEITSTSAESASAIFAGSCSIAFVPMPAVSLAPTILTSTMSDPSIIRVTVTSPPNPLAVAVSPESAPASSEPAVASDEVSSPALRSSPAALFKAACIAAKTDFEVNVEPDTASTSDSSVAPV